ncbi:MAG: response regulator transcription factor [Acidimicrobiales bacterium]
MRAAVRLDNVAPSFNTPVTMARVLGIRARATGDGKALLEAAEHHAVIGLVGSAKELADLAVAALGRSRSDARSRAKLLGREMGRRLRQADPTPGPVVPLTRRELEIATLAAKGMTDRDIATVLSGSVRTVESHLAATYRKLDIRSRQGLRGALSALGALPSE